MPVGRIFGVFSTIALVGGLLGPVAAHADPTYGFTVFEGLTYGGGFTTNATNPFGGAASGVATATFNYTGALNFNDTLPQNGGASGDLNSEFFGAASSGISSYAGSGTVASQSAGAIADYSTLGSFLGSSGSASNYQWASWYRIDLGVLAAGTQLSILHDDGVSVYQRGASVGSTVSGATTAVTDTVNLTQAGDTILYYSRQNGSPSVLDVAVPEPATIGMMAAGLLGLCFMRRRAS